MDYLNKNIAINLRKIRMAKNYSLDIVAEQTGVSKSMLGQIERGEANPTIGTIGKIVSGLRVSLEELISEPQEDVFPIERSQFEPTKEVAGQYAVYSFFPYESNRGFEIYVIRVYPGGEYVSNSHGEGTREYVVVEHGTLQIEISGKCHEIQEGDALRFDADREHIYRNTGKNAVELVSVFSFSSQKS